MLGNGIRRLPMFGAAVFMAVGATAALAEPISVTAVDFSAVNIFSQTIDGEVVSGPLTSSLGQSGSSGLVDFHRTINVGAAGGDGPPMARIEAVGRAQASFETGLKAGVSLSARDFDYGVNPPYLQPDGNILENGLSEQYRMQAGARLRDILHVSGAPDLDQIKITFHLDGTLSTPENSGDHASALLGLYASATESSDLHYIYSNAATPAQPTMNLDQYVTDMFRVIDGNVTIDLTLYTEVTYGLLGAYDSGFGGALPDGVALSDFFNTLTIDSIAGFNAAGEQVALSSVVASNGLALPTASSPSGALPEPATWATMIAGLGLVGTTLRVRPRRTIVAA